MSKFAFAEFFTDISNSIKNNTKRLSYGISVTDFNKDGRFEFIVTGFRYPNLILSYKNGYLENINKDELFADINRATIGVAACDIDNDGFEELYFLNTDTYSGQKQFSDRLLDNETNITDLFDESRIVELVDSIISQSERYKSSDIHIEPRETDIRIRFRIDGKLQDFQGLPKEISTALISRLKIMGNMDIAETRKPQDGRILFNSSKGRLDLRISTYPTLYGEKTVRRHQRRCRSLYSSPPTLTPVHDLIAVGHSLGVE